MYNRPRCRDWTPLATQQLRLRSLVRIAGYNIACIPKCQLYFTLHSTAMSAPFFTSEKVDFHGTSSVEWAEITSQQVLKSTARCVCIRVWEHRIESPQFTKQNKSNDCSLNCTNDNMLFIWGVYFSGLIPVTKRSDLKFCPNTLAFQMHGGYFVSPESLTIETIRQQVVINYEQDKVHFTNVCNCSWKASKKNPLDTDESDIIKQKIPNKTIDEFEINSPRTSRSCSPVRDQCINKTSFIDSNRDLLQMIKIRFLVKDFLISETRSSYILEKLLHLQEKQRKHKQKNEHAKEITEKICMKSAFCLNLDLISSKGFYYQSRGNPSMGRTLNRLLFQEAHVKPEDILKAQELRRLIELASFRCQLLIHEKNRIKSDFRILEWKLGELHDHTIEQESWLMSSYRNLCREKEHYLQENNTFCEKKDLLFKAQRLLRHRRTQLCNELQSIYPITKTKNDQFAVNNVILPNTDLLTNDRLINTDYPRDFVSPLSISVALGYVAHVVNMCSIIHNIPLRNPIRHEGSRTRILDIVKEIPNSSREFPLYCRSSPMPKAVSYAVYLINQNIAQLNFQIHNIKCDLRETLWNLLRLINGISPSIPEIIDLVPKNSSLSVDFHVPIPSISKPVDIVNRKSGDLRLSRSAGSYSDEQVSSSEKTFYSSEPILSAQHQVHLSQFNENCNI